MPEAVQDVEICVKVSARDVHWATLLYLANPRLLAFVALIAGAGILNAILNHQLEQLYVYVFCFLLLFLVVPWIQAFVSMRNPVMKSSFYHTLSSQGISTRFHGGSISLDWSNIRKARETEGYISVYGKRGAPMLIPKNQIPERELASVRTILKSQLRDKAKIASVKLPFTTE